MRSIAARRAAGRQVGRGRAETEPSVLSQWERWRWTGLHYGVVLLKLSRVAHTSSKLLLCLPACQCETALRCKESYGYTRSMTKENCTS